MTTLPVIRGKFGSTEYYVARMKAQEVANRLVMPKDLKEWEEMSIEERFQREVNYNRVKKHIAPYLANDEDRFFGALIVDIYNPEGIDFEPLGEVAKKLPGLYKASADSFGFLHMTGGEVLVPLDGQHRLAALRFAVTGKDEKNKDIPGLENNFDVAQDDVTLILVAHDAKKARKIFNKVNRYAKSTTKGENLITADDDIVAVACREEVVNNIIGERLVNYESNTLNKTAHHFTTLSTVYDASLWMLETMHGKIDTTSLPSKDKQKLYRENLKEIWGELISGIDLFNAAVKDASENGDAKRQEIREHTLLGKPIAQLSLIIAFMRLKSAEFPDARILSYSEICERLNRIDWKVSNKIWQKVLMNGDKVAVGKTAAKFAARFIAYLGGEPLTDVELDALRDNYRSSFYEHEQNEVELPERIVE